VLLEGAAHRSERAGIAQAQRGQALAERGDLDEARRGGGLLHAATSSTVGGLRGRIMRDAVARISAESLVVTCTCEPRVTRDSDRPSARFRHATSEGSSEIAYEGGA